MEGGRQIKKGEEIGGGREANKERFCLGQGGKRSVEGGREGRAEEEEEEGGTSREMRVQGGL